jgi:hypothetical protein
MKRLAAAWLAVLEGINISVIILVKGQCHAPALTS